LVESRIFKRKQPWRDALIASTGLSVFVLAASLLWNAGHHQWAFVLVFTATWLLLSISWSNIDFTEKSGAILASVVDHNFQRMHERMEQMERELHEVKNRLGLQAAESGPNPEVAPLQARGSTGSFSVSSMDD
jgi:hypothetical protein